MKRTNTWRSKLFVLLVLLFIYLPIIVVVVYSFNASKYGNWEGFPWSGMKSSSATRRSCAR